MLKTGLKPLASAGVMIPPPWPAYDDRIDQAAYSASSGVVGT
jgi:hypothetical protein